MFLSLELLLSLCIERVTIGLPLSNLCSQLGYFIGEFQDFSTDRYCGVWCHGLTTYLLYVSLLVGYLNKNWFVSLIWLQRFGHSFLIVLYIFIYTYRNILYYICALSFICLIFTSQIMLNFSHTVSANVVSTLFTYNQSSLLPPVQKLVSSVEVCCIGSFFTVKDMDRLSIKKCWNQ